MNKLYPVVILAGGLATRLRPVTEAIPKSLVAVNGEPFIHHQLQLLNREGIREIILCVGYLGQMIEEYVGNGQRYGLDVQYVYDPPTLLGTAGAIKQALPLIQNNFFVLYGDSYLSCHYASVQAVFEASKKSGLMTLFKNHDQWDTSNVEYQDGKIIAYDKKHRNERMHYIDYGLGIFSKEGFRHVPESEPYDLADLYQRLLKMDELAACEITERFYEIGSFAGISELERYLTYQLDTAN